MAKDVLSKLAIKANSSHLEKFEQKSGKRAVRTRKGFPLFFSNFIIKIAESLEKSSLLIDCAASETVKYKITKQEGGFHPAMMAHIAALLIASVASSFIQPVASSLINAIPGREVKGAGKGQEGEMLPLLGLPLMIKAVSGKGVTRARKRYNNMDHMEIEITQYFNYEPRFNGIFSKNNLPSLKDEENVMNLNDKQSK